MRQPVKAYLSLVLFALTAGVGLLGLSTPTQAAAGINPEINFQGRLLNSQGATVPDGNYNIQFKIYSGGSGSATGDPGGTLLWTEDWYYNGNSPDQRVSVADGYFSVLLGSICSMNGGSCQGNTNSPVNFNSDTLWLSVNIGGTTTGTPTLDGEMLPMKRFAANPYAFNAGELGGLTASQFGQLAANNVYTGTQLFQNTASSAFTIQNAAGTLTAFNADTSTGDITINGVLQAASGNNLSLDTAGSNDITIGANNASSISLGHGSIGVTIPASSSLTLGTANAATGSIAFKNSANSNILTLQSGNTAGALTFTLPTADGTNGQCLETNGSGVLSFGSCTGGIAAADTSLDNLSGVAINTTLLPGTAGAISLGSTSKPFGNLILSGSAASGSTSASNNFTITGTAVGNETITLPTVSGTVCVNSSGTLSCPTSLQQAYAASSGGSSPEITLNGTQGALDIQDAASTIGGNLLNVRASTGSGLGSLLFGVGNTGNVTVQGASGTSSTTAFQVNNDSTGSPVSILTADTTNNRIAVDATYSQMGTVGTVSHSTSTSGGALSAGTYYYKVTAVDSAGGETTPSTEVSQATTGSASTVTLSWTAVSGATGYRIYRGTTSNGEVGYYNSATATVSSGTVTFIDTGATMSSSSGSPPSTNTAYTSTAVSNNSLQLSVGGNGTPTGQLYVSGTVPSSVTGSGSTPAGGSGASSYNANEFQVYNHYAYIGTNNVANTALGVADLSNPTSPTSLGYNATANWLSGSYPTAGVIAGHYDYVVAVSSGFIGQLVVEDLSNPTVVTTAGSTAFIATSGAPSIAVSGGYAYITNYTSLSAYNIANSTSPTQTYLNSSALSISSNVGATTVVGRYLYVGEGTGASSQMQVFDLSNPTSPSLVATVATGNTPSQIVVSGRYAYVIDSGASTNNLQVFDISNPTSPSLVTSITAGNSPDSLAVSGRYAYVTSASDKTFNVINIANPSSLSSVGSYTMSATPEAMNIVGRYAYVLIAGNTMDVLDLGGTYTQSLEVGSTETGNLTVDNNETINGNSSIGGSLSVGQSVSVQGDLAISGVFTPQSSATDPTCSPGAMYYNTTTTTVRVCQQSAWQDVASGGDLALMSYGIIPNSGTSPGDLASITSYPSSGPCKVSLATASSLVIAITGCNAYSGGNFVSVAAQSSYTLNTTSTCGSATVSTWYHIYITSTGAIGCIGSSTEVGSIPTFSVTAPLVNLADIKTNGSSQASAIYDTRTFLSTTKSYATINAAAALGTIVQQTSTAGLVQQTNSATASNIQGVIIASTGAASSSTINIIIATAGPAFIKSITSGTTPSANSNVIPTTTSGYAGGGTNASAYGTLGVALITTSTNANCTLGSVAQQCQMSVYTNLNIR